MRQQDRDILGMWNSVLRFRTRVCWARRRCGSNREAGGRAKRKDSLRKWKKVLCCRMFWTKFEPSSREKKVDPDPPWRFWPWRSYWILLLRRNTPFVFRLTIRLSGILSISFKSRCNRDISCARVKVSNCKAIAESNGWPLLFSKSKWPKGVLFEMGKLAGETYFFTWRLRWQINNWLI